jgi:hypothetical protein
MSKSYKKYPIVKQEKEDYHYLNRKLRHDKLAAIPNGSFYKKYVNKCHEWKYIWTKEQAIRQYNEDEWIRERFPTLEMWINYWKTCVLRK